MGYGMKYTKGGFPFKASPTKQKENTTPHFLEKKPNPTVKAQKSKSTYNEKEEQTIENMSNAKDNNFDGHMEMKINNYKKASKGMNKGISKVKKIHPSFPATPEGSKKRSKAERAHEAREDAKGY